MTLNLGHPGLGSSGLQSNNTVASAVDAAIQDLALFYDFVQTPDLNAEVITGMTSTPTLDITRASTAKVTDWESVIREVQSGEARFTGARRVQNNIPNSNDFSLAQWNKTNSTVTQDGPIAPTGEQMWSLTDDATDDAHLIIDGGVTDPLTDSHVLSVYAKATTTSGAGRYLILCRRTYNVSVGRVAIYDLVDGTVVLDPASRHVPSIVDEGGGVYRCVLHHDYDSSSNGSFTVGLADGPLDADRVYAGSGKSIWISSTQMEDTHGQADPYAPSEYVPSVGGLTTAKWYATKRRTNLLPYSNLGTGWLLSRCTKSTSAITDPNGGANSYLLTADGASSGAMRAYRVDTVSDYNGNITLSAHVKKGTVDFAWLDTTHVESAAAVRFNILLGTVTAEGSSVSSSSIIDAGDGWWRISATYDAGTASLTQPGAGYIGLSDVDAFTCTNAGTESMYIYGAMSERANSVTAYIETTGTVASSDFDTAITPTGLLIEEDRINVCLQSEDFSTSWILSRNTVTTDQSIAPDGTLTADKIEDAGGGTTSSVYQSITFATSTTYCVSKFYKADVTDWAQLVVANMGSLDISAYFDLTNGVVGATLGANNTDAGIEDAGSGWYRCWIVFTSDSSDVSGIIQTFIADADNDTTVDTGDSIFVWGAQLEAGSFPTSYIPTTTGSVTRNSDDIVTTDVSWYNTDEGTFYLNASQTYFGGGTDLFFEASDNSTSDRWYIASNVADGQAGSIVKSVGVVQASLSKTAAMTEGVLSKFAYGALVNNMDFYIDGVRAGTGDQVATMPVGISQLNIGAGFNNLNIINGHIAEIRYYRVRKSNEYLQTLSNGGYPITL